MNQKDLLFMVMDIPAVVERLVKTTLNDATCAGMGPTEYLAYSMGINNTISALSALVNDDVGIVAHMPDLQRPTEMDIKELASYLDYYE